MPRTEPCGYRRVTAALRPRGRGRVGRGTVRTRPCVPRARQAAAPPKGPAPPLPGRRARGSRPDLVRRGSRRQQARDEVGGRYPPVSEPGEEGSICLTTVPGLLHQEGGRLRHWGDHARHRPLVCEAIDMAARRCPTRRDKTIFHPAPGRGSPARLRPARQAPEGLRHSSFGGQDRGVLGGCPGGGRRVRPSKERKSPRQWCTPPDARPSTTLPPGSSPVHKSDASSLGARVPDAGRGRTRSGKQ